MNYKYSDFIDGNMAIHRYDYDFMDDIDPTNKTEDVINWVIDKLKDGNAYACNVRDINTLVNKYKYWHDTAYSYYDPRTVKNEKTWGLVCAAFGYAIEEYVNDQVRGKGYPHASDFDVEVQLPEGKTIPDVRIFMKNYDSEGNIITTEVAWLDITSMASVCHIYKKRSQGWRTKPIVIELVYPALDFSNLTL